MNNLLKFIQGIAQFFNWYFAIPDLIFAGAKQLGGIRMDPVNKWLVTIIIMFTVLIATIGWKSGSGRYEMTVMPSQYDNHQTIYVLDTRSGDVEAKLQSADDFLTKEGKVKNYFVTVKKEKPSWRNNYNNTYTPKKRRPHVYGQSPTYQ
jgi:hypothetical protein